jgi:hypothetical protein
MLDAARSYLTELGIEQPQGASVSRCERGRRGTEIVIGRGSAMEVSRSDPDPLDRQEEPNRLRRRLATGYPSGNEIELAADTGDEAGVQR